MKIIELRRSKGLPVPIPEAVVLDPWRFDLWEAFWLINRSRQYNGMSGSPMPVSLEAIKTYVDLCGTTDLDALIEVVLQMDNVYLDHYHQKAEDAREEAENASTNRTNGVVNGRHIRRNRS